MLQEIRERTQGWFASVIISLIILSFALWGVHSYFVGGNTNNSVAEVNGESISPQQVNIAYQQYLNQLQAMSPKERIDPAPLEKMLRQRALQSIIEDMVQKQSAQKIGFVVTDADIDKALQMVPAFQENNRFSVNRFNAVLNAAGITPGYFLSMMRGSLLIDQPRFGLTSSAFILPVENQQAAILLLEKRNIDYLEVNKDEVKSKITPVTVADIKKYYDSHQAELMTAEKVSIEYINLSLDDVVKTIHPSEEDLKNFYENNKQSFLDDTKKTATPLPYLQIEEKVKSNFIRQKAEEKYTQRKEQLADLAYEHPESLQSAATQLQLQIKRSGSFSKNESVSDSVMNNKKVQDLAFSADLIDKQINSDVITLDNNNVAVIRIAQHERPRLKALDDVKTQIVQHLLSTKTAHAIETYANNLVTQLAKQDPATLHLQWKQLGWVGRHDNKFDQAILAAAFKLPPATQSHPAYGVAVTEKEYVIVGVKGIEAGQIAAHDKVSMLEQLALAQGEYEYALYKQSLLQAAKITVN